MSRSEEAPKSQRPEALSEREAQRQLRELRVFLESLKNPVAFPITKKARHQASKNVRRWVNVLREVLGDPIGDVSHG